MMHIVLELSFFVGGILNYHDSHIYNISSTSTQFLLLFEFM
jgi:hypothetical protein